MTITFLPIEKTVDSERCKKNKRNKTQNYFVSTLLLVGTALLL